MKLILAEKPDLARAIADGIDGNLKTFDGYLTKGEYVLTWAFGHILELFMPEDYDERYKAWNIADLPYIITDFKYKPISEKKKQLKLICDLIRDNRINSIVNCGDADEEGQTLIDEIINYSNTNKPIERVMLQDLTPKGVKAAFKDIKPNSAYKGMSECGFARSHADWLLGINLTRAYTATAQKNGYKGVLSVGRVQTPILGLIVARDLEHENHKSSFYYTITGEFSSDNKKFFANLKTDEKILDPQIAENIKEKLDGNSCDLKITNENKKENPPLPYNLLKLQAECSKKFGYKPDKTLQITQNLREKYKCITYNRSDCEYLPENMWESSQDVLNAVRASLKDDEFNAAIDNADTRIKGIAFNDQFITAHFAIIPTQAVVDANMMSKEELNVYKLIAKRFIAQFYEPMEYLQTTLEVTKFEYKFSASKRKIMKIGYLSLFNDKTDDDDNNESNDDEVKNSIDLSTLKDGICDVIDLVINKKQTRAKPYYTMPTLLKDLASISKYVKDERIKRLLKEKDKDKKGENGGIGTPATRSYHIKNLFDREYISENGKSIVSTQKGRELINLVPALLSSPDMTALWYEQQKDILGGNLARSEFLNQVIETIQTEIASITSNQNISNFNSNSIDKTYPCKCGKGYLQRRQSTKTKGFFWGCSDWKNGCKEMYPDVKGKPQFEKAAASGGITCPFCKKGILERKKNQKGTYWWGCSEWKNGCKAMFYDDNGKPKIIKG